MKKSVDINIEIIVGATIAILVKGFPGFFFWSRTRAGIHVPTLGRIGLWSSSWMPSDPLPSVYYIYFNNKIFYIKENVSAKSNGNLNPDIIWDSLWIQQSPQPCLGGFRFVPDPGTVKLGEVSLRSER